ncbi:murein transglycosylase A [Paludibacterium yongneupense]|uniref:murein transglycosylase A n=1 Tax=Paludibacterium yongneupense TaxID=400061 RepID=UPI00040A9C83|nr:MltA domain-containing protein [Paludibacterium yongneupense]
MRSRLILIALLGLAACSSAPPLVPYSSQPAPVAGRADLEQIEVGALPSWPGPSLAGSLEAFRRTCRETGQRRDWRAVCAAAATLDARDEDAIRRFFEARFSAWQLHDGARERGLITGYYEPMLNGSLNRSERTPYPVYGVPSDLMTLDLPAAARTRSVAVARRAAGNRLVWVPGVSTPGAGQVEVWLSDFPAAMHGGSLKGRIEGGRLLPYYTRAEIARGQGGARAPVLAWVDDAVELFFLQVQGSGRIQLDDGRILRVGVADNNGYAYVSIGRWLADHGQLPLSSASMQGIQGWVRTNPQRQQELFDVNPRYVYFRASAAGAEGPVGALGVPLTDGYSIAVDPRYIPLGTPVWLSTTWPQSDAPLARLVAAQDVGNAIRGALRADLFWGYGTEAGLYAGRMKQQGSLWLLLPKGVRPGA